MRHLFLILMALVTFTSSAQAILEFRASYTNMDLEYDPQLGNEPALSGLGVDAIVSLPLFPFAFGVRHEALSGDDGAELDLDRTSAILSFRIIDTLVLAGFIATYGLSHDSELNNANLEIDSSYTVGVEAGVKFIGNYVFAGELGYSSIESENPNRDMTGPYMKAHIGVTF